MKREDWLNLAVESLRPLFESVGHPLPDKIRVTCGFPSRGGRGAVIGEHHSPAASADNHHEIFITPKQDNPIEVMGILVHELAHAATDGDGHKGRFPALVKKLFLDGKPTHTVVGEQFKENLGPLTESLGAYPHARLNAEDKYKTQGTRLLKAYCPACGFTIRLTKKWADVGLPVCPVDNNQFTL